jgi:hypothetical protein
MIPALHRNSRLANQTIKWHGTDQEELYQQNLIKNRSNLEQYNWVDRPITYKFNSHGFRADEFDSAGSNVMFLGCSHTEGIGLPYESTWAHIVSTKLKLKNYNLGIGGASNDTAFRMAHHWIDQLKPDLVIFLSIEKTRIELHTGDDRIFDLGVWRHDFPMADNFLKHWHSNDINSDMNYLKNMLAVKQLCNENSIKFLHTEMCSISGVDKARDLQHYGEKTQRGIANMFLSKL